MIRITLYDKFIKDMLQGRLVTSEDYDSYIKSLEIKKIMLKVKQDRSNFNIEWSLIKQQIWWGEVLKFNKFYHEENRKIYVKLNNFISDINSLKKEKEEFLKISRIFDNEYITLYKEYLQFTHRISEDSNSIDIKDFINFTEISEIRSVDTKLEYSTLDFLLEELMYLQDFIDFYDFADSCNYFKTYSILKKIADEPDEYNLDSNLESFVNLESFEDSVNYKLSKNHASKLSDLRLKVKFVNLYNKHLILVDNIKSLKGEKILLNILSEIKYLTLYDEFINLKTEYVDLKRILKKV